MSRSRSYRRKGPGRMAKKGLRQPGWKLWKAVRKTALGGVIGGR